MQGPEREQLYNVLFASTSISWNKDSEVPVRGKVFPASNIDSLLEDSLTDSAHLPVGGVSFYRKLAESGVSLRLVKNPL